MRDFNMWLSDFRDSIADYGYYIDFEKVHRHVNGIKVEFNILNSLIGADNIEKKFEDLVEGFIKKAGFIKDVNYFKEMYIHQITERWNIDLSAISNQGKMEKRFDFIVKTSHMIYGIETNFYGSGGSKLNETARSYKTLATEADTIDNFTFVWFTDGKGWTSARHNLEETFDMMEHIYNIKDLENGIITEVFR